MVFNNGFFMQGAGEGEADWSEFDGSNNEIYSEIIDFNPDTMEAIIAIDYHSDNRIVLATNNITQTEMGVRTMDYDGSSFTLNTFEQIYNGASDGVVLVQQGDPGAILRHLTTGSYGWMGYKVNSDGTITADSTSTIVTFTTNSSDRPIWGKYQTLTGPILYGYPRTAGSTYYAEHEMFELDSNGKPSLYSTNTIANQIVSVNQTFQNFCFVDTDKAVRFYVPNGTTSMRYTYITISGTTLSVSSDKNPSVTYIPNYDVITPIKLGNYILLAYRSGQASYALRFASFSFDADAETVTKIDEIDWIDSGTWTMYSTPWQGLIAINDNEAFHVARFREDGTTFYSKLLKISLDEDGNITVDYDHNLFDDNVSGFFYITKLNSSAYVVVRMRSSRYLEAEVIKP